MSAPPSPSSGDDAAIRNLLARYCLTLDHDDVDGFVELFTPDCEYHVYGRVWEGHDGLRTMLAAAPGGLHLGGPSEITLDGDRATTRQNLLFVDRESGDQRGAVYDDELVRTPDGWRIHTRRCRFITSVGLSDRPE